MYYVMSFTLKTATSMRRSRARLRPRLLGA